jgi:flagellar biosynthesis protein FliR
MDIQVACYPQVFVLILARLAAVIGSTSIFGRSLVPPKIRLAAAFAIALLLTPMAPAAWVQASALLNTVPALLVAMLGEVLLGAAIGLVCDMFISVCLVAGYVAGLSSSLTMAEVIDPMNGVGNNILGELLQLVFWMAILVSNGHLLLIKMIAASLGTVPPLTLWCTQDMLSQLVALGSVVFNAGIRLVTPVVAAVLIVDCSFGLVSRMAPDFNILFLSFPVRLLVGLAAFGCVLRFGNASMLNLMENWLAACGRLLSV